MARGAPVDIDKRQNIIKYFLKGLRVFEIAKKLRIKWSTVKSIIQRYESEGALSVAPRSGRPRCTGPRMDRKIINTALQNRRMTLKDLGRTIRESTGTKICNKTIQKRLHDAKIYGRAARKKPWISEKHRKARLTWCKNRLNWTPVQWGNVLWSDESKFCLFGSKGCQRVWRRSGEALRPECHQVTVKHGGGKSTPFNGHFPVCNFFVSSSVNL